ncbi:hypothetical protein Droror1_Dr00017994 [Drosera rotundifolia]
MNNFHGLLSSDYGFKPQGKFAPMAPPLRPHNPNNNFTNSSSSPFDTDSLFRSHHSETTANPDPFDDIFGVKKWNSSSNSVNLDSIFGCNGGRGGGVESGVRFLSLPVFDKPVYDDEGDGVGDDVFGGVEYDYNFMENQHYKDWNFVAFKLLPFRDMMRKVNCLRSRQMK